MIKLNSIALDFSTGISPTCQQLVRYRGGLVWPKAGTQLLDAKWEKKREGNGRIKMKGKTKKGRRTVRNDRRGIRTAPKSWTIFNCHTSVTRSKPRLIVFSFHFFFFHAFHAGNRSFSYFSRVHGGTGKNSTTKHRWKSEAIDEWIPYNRAHPLFLLGFIVFNVRFVNLLPCYRDSMKSMEDSRSVDSMFHRAISASV